MTSTVTIEAHCGNENVVEMIISEGGKAIDRRTLQDGESHTEYVYDDRAITVREIRAGMEDTNTRNQTSSDESGLAQEQ